MKISVVIPAYNEEKLIARCLESIKKQDYTGHYEIIVVDNNSTDRTADISREWGAKIVQEKRQGYVYAVARGFAEARGEIIATTDADAVVPTHWLSTLVDCFQKNPEVVAVGGRITFYDADWKIHLFEKYFFPVIYWFDKSAGRGPHLWGPNLAVRQEPFLRAGGWNFNVNLQADNEITDRLRKVGKVLILDDFLVPTSSRRWKKDFLRNALLYSINFLSLEYYKKPLFRGFPVVR